MKSTTKIIGGAILASVTLAVGFIKPFEAPAGVPSKPYYDVGHVPTDCYGNTLHVDMHIIRSKAECDDLLTNDVQKRADRIAEILHPYPNPESAAAFISLAYNCGLGRFERSNIPSLWNAGKFREACAAIQNLCTTVKGKFVLGLQNRRIKEAGICLKGLQND